MAVKTQGTELYFIYPGDSEGEVVARAVCVTSIDGLSAPIDQIETTCLEDEDAEYEAGLRRPGTVTFGINFDPQEESHLQLHELYENKTKVNWVLGFSDGKGIAPTGIDSDGDFVLPDTRSWLTFRGYVNDFPFSLPLNAVVSSTIGVQVSGAIVPIKKAVA